MARRVIIIDFEPGYVHRVQNFGEALWHACKEDGWASISLKEIDRASTRLCVEVLSARRVRRIFSLTSELLERHNLREMARMTVVRGEP